MTVVDSSGWIEYFTNGDLAGRFEAHLADLSAVVTPTIVIYEVYRVMRRELSEEEATAVAAQMQKTRVADLDQFTALTAADLGLRHGLAMADAIVYATAVVNDAELVTADGDFTDLPGVIVYEM